MKPPNFNILIDSEMNILLAFTTIWVMYNAYLTKDIGFLKQNILMSLIVKRPRFNTLL